MDPRRRRIVTALSSLTALAGLGPAAVHARGGKTTGPTRSGITVVRHICPDSPYDLRNRYFLDLLRLALEKTAAQDGPFRLQPIAAALPQSRAIAEMANDRLLDVLWTMTTSAREATLLPVRIPLLKGLMGYRVFIVRRGEEARFAGINTLAALKPLVAVQGHDWPDADILAANGLQVVRSSNYESLFGMLQLKRADYFPRAVTEPWDELQAPHRDGLAVEPHLLLRYTTDNYFFTSRHNPLLADRIERGLRLAIADGSFEHLFRNHPANARALARANLAERRIIELKNPLLSPETPVHDPSLWFHLS